MLTPRNLGLEGAQSSSANFISLTEIKAVIDTLKFKVSCLFLPSLYFSGKAILFGGSSPVLLVETSMEGRVRIF